MHPEANAPLLQPVSPRYNQLVKYTTVRRDKKQIQDLWNLNTMSVEIVYWS